MLHNVNATSDKADNSSVRSKEHHYHSRTHPLNESFICGDLKVPQVNVSTLGAHSHSGVVSGVPLQTGDSAIEGAGGMVEMVGGQRASERLQETLKKRGKRTSQHDQ